MHARKEHKYKWSILPLKQYLFEKNLSKLFTGVYTQSIQGIGVFFEALPQEPSPTQVTIQEPMNEPESFNESYRLLGSDFLAGDRGSAEEDRPEASFMAHIHQWQNEIALLQAELRQWQNSAKTETGQRKNLEKELERGLRVAFSCSPIIAFLIWPVSTESRAAATKSLCCVVIFKLCMIRRWHKNETLSVICRSHMGWGHFAGQRATAKCPRRCS